MNEGNCILVCLMDIDIIWYNVMRIYKIILQILIYTLDIFCLLQVRLVQFLWKNTYSIMFEWCLFTRWWQGESQSIGKRMFKIDSKRFRWEERDFITSGVRREDTLKSTASYKLNQLRLVHIIYVSWLVWICSTTDSIVDDLTR